jgi:hypothetical protein
MENIKAGAEATVAWAINNWILAGILIAAVMVIMWHLITWHWRPSPSSLAIKRLKEWPGWVVEGTNPTLEIDPVEVRLNGMTYHVYEGGIHTYIGRARITAVEDGISTCTGLYIRPSGNDLEVKLSSKDPFRPMKRVTSPMVLASDS